MDDFYSQDDDEMNFEYTLTNFFFFEIMCIGINMLQHFQLVCNHLTKALLQDL